MNWYFIGTVKGILKNSMTTTEDLHSDSRLVINEDFYVFTDEENLNEVTHVYGVEDEVDVIEWAEDDPYEFRIYIQDVEDRFVPFVDSDDVGELFGIRLNELSREELMNAQLGELYKELIERVIVRNLKWQAHQIEEKLKFRDSIKEQYPDN